MTDLVFAILHHVAVFALVGALAAEAALMRDASTREGVARLIRLDGLYGGLAMAVIIVGLLRVFHGVRGWEFYVYYWAFWAKMAAIAVVGLMSIPPTLRFRRWQKAMTSDTAYAVPQGEIADVRRWIHRQFLVLALVPVFAAVMARGIGY